MRVFNLTDVSTPTLVRYGLLNQQIVVHRRSVSPGEYVEVEDTVDMRTRLEHVLTLGAVSIDQLPPAYAQARQQQQATQHSTFAGIPVRHVDLQETKVAGTINQPQPSSVDAAITPIRRKGRP